MTDGTTNAIPQSFWDNFAQAQGERAAWARADDPTAQSLRVVSGQGLNRQEHFRREFTRDVAAKESGVFRAQSHLRPALAFDKPKIDGKHQRMTLPVDKMIEMFFPDAKAYAPIQSLASKRAQKFATDKTITLGKGKKPEFTNPQLLTMLRHVGLSHQLAAIRKPLLLHLILIFHKMQLPEDTWLELMQILLFLENLMLDETDFAAAITQKVKNPNSTTQKEMARTIRDHCGKIQLLPKQDRSRDNPELQGVNAYELNSSQKVFSLTNDFFPTQANTPRNNNQSNGNNKNRGGGRGGNGGRGRGRNRNRNKGRGRGKKRNNDSDRNNNKRSRNGEAENDPISVKRE